ncbi:hypothetical protein LX87_04893 [Larkinella arboricola]|uniref:TraB family protein n=1 Tax=Larkinella arboricola TaxID=643671 RepID=A0A327WPA5_LARAB|nr:TraB/GumN family protein [Larkinella arboricola]RAJ92563.1 hypothetical protein LX87_04893 [Larkinella arboricola]
MKFDSSFHFLLLTFLLLSHYAVGQKRTKITPSNPPTILWKITGKDCKQPSYLLGTFHLADAEWLYEYPEIKKVIDSTEFILTEAFTTERTETPFAKTGSQLKALSLLTPEQYRTLDSFFVARVGEGIVGNPDAETMTVAEMRNAILTTLATQSKEANGITKFMDLDLFRLYEKLGRKGDRLDRVTPTEFDSTNIDQAKQYLARSLKYLENSDKPDWNIYQMTGVDETVAHYKKMEFDYKLNERAVNVQTSTDFDFIPVEQRNKNWMSKIIAAISTKPCLIAVGLGHLYYRTGVIMLLRDRGYQVEPVIFQ